MQYDDSYGWEKSSHTVYLWDFPARHTSVPKIDIMGFFEIIGSRMTDYQTMANIKVN